MKTAQGQGLVYSKQIIQNTYLPPRNWAASEQMIQFLAPFWLLALPLALLPWFFPVFQKPKGSPYLFSAFLLLPDQTRRKKPRFSLEDFLLKLLRSFIILLICFILACPFWQEATRTPAVWVVDDTFSRFLSNSQEPLQLLENLEPALTRPPAWKLSELFTKPPHRPVQSIGDWSDLTTASPHLAEIGRLVLKKSAQEHGAEMLQVHLVSDFQQSQYEFYQSTTPSLEWVFHRPIQSKFHSNLALQNIDLESVGLFEFKLTGEMYGRFPQESSTRVVVWQKGRSVGAKSVPWQAEGTQKFEIFLNEDFERHAPLEIVLEGEHGGNVLDNPRFFQWNPAQNFWVSIVTSEGNSGIYRHGLHQLKSALNANQTFAFLSATLEDLQAHPPDILLLLGDHPFRWTETLKAHAPKLFIPTRLGDWKAVSMQLESAMGGLPKAQWRVDWSKTPFAEEGQIEQINDALYYSPTWNLWLLATGVSPQWGPLYQDVVFADELQGWLALLSEKALHQYWGTLEIGSPLLQKIDPEAQTSHWTPGHYRIEDPQTAKIYHFSLNLPRQESEPHLLSKGQLVEMQSYFTQQSQQMSAQKAMPAVNEWREMLLWGLWGLLLLELFYLVARLIKNGRGHGKYSFD